MDCRLPGRRAAPPGSPSASDGSAPAHRHRSSSQTGQPMPAAGRI